MSQTAFYSNAQCHTLKTVLVAVLLATRVSVTGSDRYCSSSCRVSALFVVLLFCNLTGNQLLHLTWESNLTTKVWVLFGSVIVIVRFGSGSVVKLFGFVWFGSEWPSNGVRVRGVRFGSGSIPISSHQLTANSTHNVDSLLTHRRETAFPLTYGCRNNHVVKFLPFS